MEPAKPWYESKTIWANVLSIAIAILILVADVPGLSPESRTWLTVILGIANILLRFVTDQPIAARRD